MVFFILGAYVFWEFATDYYDLGFGVYFEWSDAPTQQVSVHVNETTDEEGSADEVEDEKDAGGDIESGAAAATKNRPIADEIVPIFRRESHTEVRDASSVLTLVWNEASGCSPEASLQAWLF